MLATATGAECSWMCNGQAVFPAMLAAIDNARQSVCLETYTCSPGLLADRFLDAFLRARQRGLPVRVLVDALGSYGLSSSFWRPLEQAGGEVRRFNPLSLNRLSIRDHRKLLVCDQQVAFVGGFNIASEYEGDGIACGWCDLGLKVEGPLAAKLADAFDEMFVRADFQHKPFVRLRKLGAKKTLAAQESPLTLLAPPPSGRGLGSSSPELVLCASPAKEQLLLSGPGRERSPIKRALHRDLARARSVQIIAAYFLPPWRLRRQLLRVARRGGRVQLLLAAKSDVTVAILAARSLYRRFLKAGVEISEYQPQILHAKLIIIDDAVYVGSANLDQRSLNINFELMIRFESKEMANQAREVFSNCLRQCLAIRQEEWRTSRSLWQRLKQRWAYFLLARIDPYIAHRQWRGLPD